MDRLWLDRRSFRQRLSGQSIFLRGAALSSHSKLPVSHSSPSPLSFIGHPLALKDAPHYLLSLKRSGFNLVRLVVCWEAIEHSGPGRYDHAYIDYLVSLVRICQDLLLYVLIDAHQDVWSRSSGGSGAPLWTLALAGFDPQNLHPSAAALRYDLGAPPGSWPSGYQKLAPATMFTLFFAANHFAPNRLVSKKLHHLWAQHIPDDDLHLISLQQFLQDSICQAFATLALALAHFDCVIGFEPINEPHRGFINLHSPYSWNPTTDLFLHDCPSFIQSLALGDGHPQKINVFTPTWPIPSLSFHRRTFVPPCRAWKSGVDCIWKEHGVWRWDHLRQKPVILKPSYFNLDPNTGKEFDFYRQALFPFICKFANHVHKFRPDWFIVAGPIPNEFYPAWDVDQRPKNLVAGPHFYDLFSLVHKSHGPITLDVQAICNKKPIWKWIYFGRRAAKKNYAQQVRNTIQSVYQNMGDVPVIIGETGICMDSNQSEGFRTGNFYWQEHQMDAVISAMESNLVSFVIWNFDPYNTDQAGDGWNGENFSFVSQSEMDPHSDRSGTRLLTVIQRPHAVKVGGVALKNAYDFETSSFEFHCQNHSHNQSSPTLMESDIYFPFDINQAQIEMSDGSYSFDDQTRIINWKHHRTDPDDVHFIKIVKTNQVGDQSSMRDRHPPSSWIQGFFGQKVMLLSFLMVLIVIVMNRWYD